MEKCYSQSQRKKEMLDESIDMLSRMMLACRDIKNGKPEISTLKQYNINQQSFRKIVFNKKLGFKYNNPPISMEELKDIKDNKFMSLTTEMYDDKNITLSWQEKLFCKIYMTDDLKEIPYDLDKRFDYVFTKLSKNEVDVLTMRYKDEMTFSKIAETMELSIPRVHQIESGAIRKLSHPSLLMILLYGEEYGKLFNQVKGINNENKRKEKFKDLEDIIEASLEANDYRNLMILRKKIDKTLRDKGMDPDMIDKDKSILDLNLSTRTKSALLRSNINGVGDLSDLTLKEMMEIRGVGDKTIVELIIALEEAGIDAAFVKEYKKQ